MAGYIITDVEVLNPDGFTEYSRQVLDTLAPYGGKFLVRGGAVDVMEGEWKPQRAVVIEFESVERAKAWYRSPEYQRIVPVRMRNARASMIVVEGVEA